jgi:DNA topoisomerase VI subunit B
MSAVLAREVFSTSRLAEFCSRQQLVTATGHAVEYWPLYVMKELIDNALDNCEEHGIAPTVEIELAAGRITVTDNGSGLPAEVLDRILNYETRTSSREAYVSPTRGAQGNALQTVLALPFALDGKVGRVTVEARSQAHEIEFRIDEIHQKPMVARSTGPSLVQNGTRITIWWPELASSSAIR